MNGLQCRLARTALGLGVRDLASLAEVSTNTITRLEGGEELKAQTVATIRAVLEGAGVLFIDANGEGPGVRLRKMPTMEPRQHKAGSSTWFVLLTWPSGSEDQISEFATEDEAAAWISDAAPAWLAKRWAAGSDS